MLFNSIDFAIFLPLVFMLYWFVFQKNLKLQNAFVFAASYLFYGWWDYRFLLLILFSTVVDFMVGVKLKREIRPQVRKFLLLTSIVVNIGFLGFFKYYNFFLENFVDAFSFFGYAFSGSSLQIILPVGISFYTFQTLSYSIDVYKRKLEPTQDFVAFGAFVSFFPQLVAGPIERATNLLPQFYRKRNFDRALAVDGMRQILWGLVKKVLIADNSAVIANQIFNHSEQYNGSALLLGAVFFAFQIYGDFSGYSDIAIGTARLFGFNLMQNFNFPYFSRNIAEFWRRWHISLSTWFRDYLYIPLGGSRGGLFFKIRNTFMIFLVSGFWHGANWTFLVWGGLNALYFLPLLLTKNNRNHLDTVAQGKILPSIKEFLQMFATFLLTVLAWVFFRAENIGHAMDILSEIFSTGLLAKPGIARLPGFDVTVALIFVFLILEWKGRTYQYALQFIAKVNKRPARWAVYYLIILVLILFGGQQQEFIYFQF